MKTLRLPVLVTLALFFVWNSGAIAEDAMPGNIRVVKVKGTVDQVNNTTKSSAPLKEGAFINQDHSVKTGADSTAILLFSNGTTIVVRPSSVFSIDTFTQVPYDSTGVQFKDLKQEPSVSQTKVSVKEGAIIANVAKLQKGSTMDIGTPVGVAGIRGTIVQVSITRQDGGAQSVNISVPEGSVVFTAPNGKTTALSGGSTISFSAAGTGAQPTQLTPQEAAEIVAQINEALAGLPIQAAFEGVADGSAETGGTGNNGEGQAGGFGGDGGAGSVGTAPGGGGGGGGSGGGSTGNSTSSGSGNGTIIIQPTPNPPVS